jgi:hypothetical protein
MKFGTTEWEMLCSAGYFLESKDRTRVKSTLSRIDVVRGK